MCGSGLSVDVQGELDARIAKILGAVSASGQTGVDVGDAMSVLENLETDNAKSDVFRSYVQCVIQVVNALGGPATSSDVVVDNLLVPAPISVIASNKRFSAKEGETRGLLDDKQIFVIRSIGSNYIKYRMTDSLSANNESSTLWLGNTMEDLRGCSLTLYSIDENETQASFTYLCS